MTEKHKNIFKITPNIVISLILIKTFLDFIDLNIVFFRENDLNIMIRGLLSVIVFSFIGITSFMNIKGNLRNVVKMVNYSYVFMFIEIAIIIIFSNL